MCGEVGEINEVHVSVTPCQIMGITRGGEGDRERGNFALLDNITMCDRVVGVSM